MGGSGLNILKSIGLLLVVACASFAATAHARGHSLAQQMCVAGAESASEALALDPAELDCSENRFSKRDRFIRSHTRIAPDLEAGDETLYWQTDPANFDSMLLRFTFADGETKLVDVDPQMATRNWFVRTRFSVPVPQSEARLTSIDTVVERPRTYATIREARLVERSEAESEHYFRSVIYALLCGMLLVPIVYDLLFLRLFRYRFLIWHPIMALGMLGFALFNSGLIFLLVPDISLATRWQFNTATLVLTALASIFFVLDMLDKEKVPRNLVRALLGFTVLMVFVKLITVFDIEGLRILSHLALLYSMIPVSAILLGVLGVALLNESRGAIFLLAAFGGLLMGGVLSLLTNLNLYQPPFHVDDFLTAALVLLVIGSSAAVGDRFMVLRVERDRARIRAIKLGRLALTDPLTGLANRRAFDAVENIEEGQALLVVDIDHFKAINDEKGHTTGDAVLCQMASLMREYFAANPASTIYRLGGEEFAVVFSCTDEHEMRTVSEKLRQHIDSNIGEDSVGIPHATVSIGAAFGLGRPLYEVFEAADEAMYRAKRAGRNRSAAVDHDGKITVVARSA